MSETSMNPANATTPARIVLTWLMLGVVGAVLVRVWMKPATDGAVEPRAAAAAPGGQSSVAADAPAVPRDAEKHEATLTADAPPDPGGRPVGGGAPELHDLHNAVCPIMDAEVGDYEAGWIAYNGMKLHFCCPGCWFDFAEDPIAHLEHLRDDFGVELPAGALDADRNPALVDLGNEFSPVSERPVEAAVVAVDRGIVVHLADRSEILTFLARSDEYFAAMISEGLPVPQERLRR